MARAQIGPFRDKQIGLLQTFADQAVIAIENVRLFTELGGHATTTLTEALEQQTATSEILRVISSSQTDVQPVFEAIAQSAALALCGATGRSHPSFDGDLITSAASYGCAPERDRGAASAFPRRPSRGVSARTRRS